MKAKRIFLSLSLFSILGLTACSMGVKSLTPTEVPREPSGVYTIKARIAPQSETIERESVSAQIVIDGETFPMRQSAEDENVFEYDYRMPEGRNEVFYSFVINYRLYWPGRDEATLREHRSLMEGFRVRSVAATALGADRAPIGGAVNLRGRDFKVEDRVLVGSTPADTRFLSDEHIRFVVPNVRSEVRHTVELRRGDELERIGTLFVEPASPLSVVPAAIELGAGQRQALVISIEQAAPSRGLPISVETDIPNSITMPEVRIPEGARTVSVTVEGTARGSGELFISAPGYPEISVPVTIR